MAIAALGLTAFETVSLASSAVAVGATVASASKARTTANAQADSVRQVADYNAKVDAANAEQQALNANANIQRQRQDNAAYQSKQRAAYAASGILSGTGSPMAVLATTAGRQEQEIQQYWTDTQTKESNLYAGAGLGRYEGEKQAEAFHSQGVAAVFQGIGSVAHIVGGAASQYSDYAAGQKLGATAPLKVPKSATRDIPAFKPAFAGYA